MVAQTQKLIIMPSCFQLICKETNEPVSLVSIDEQICKEVYNCGPHPRLYGGTVFNWYDTIGFQLASGKTLEDDENSVRAYYAANDIWQEELPVINKVLDYLQQRFTARSWYSPRK